MIEKLSEFAGVDTIDEALAVWGEEREAMRQMASELQSARQRVRLLEEVIGFSNKAFGVIEMEGALFLPRKAIDAINRAVERIKKLDG